MEFRVDELAPCRKRVTVTVPPERVREEFDRQYDEINDNVALPGFRKGRAPRKLLEKRFATQLGAEVKEKLVQSALDQLVEDKKVDPLKSPEIDLESLELEPEAAFEFEFEVVTKPEFETPEFKGLEVKVPALEITDDDVQSAVDGLRRREAELLTVEDAAITAEDILVLDWKALDGDSVEAHDENAYYPYGRGVVSGFVVEGIDEQLEGKGPGATAKVKGRVTSDDAREEFRDREFDFEVVVKEVKRYVLPEVDEAFLERHDYDDLDEMHDDVRKQLGRAYQRERDRLAEELIVERLCEGVEMSLPEEFVEKQLEEWVRGKRTSLQMEEAPEEEIEKKIDAERTDAKAHLEHDMKQFFVLDRIAEVEDVRVAEADILQAIQGIARAYGRPEEEVISSFRDPQRMTDLANQVRQRKTREVLRQHANVVEEIVDAKGKAKGDEKKKD